MYQKLVFFYTAGQIDLFPSQDYSYTIAKDKEYIIIVQLERLSINAIF